MGLFKNFFEGNVSEAEKKSYPAEVKFRADLKPSEYPAARANLVELNEALEPSKE